MHAQRPQASPAFTLIELMIVVVIVGVLAVVAIGALSKMIQRSHKAEIGAVFAAFAAGEETYKSEKGLYVALSSNNGAYNASGAPDASFVPALGSGSSEPSAKAWKAVEPVAWTMAAFNYPNQSMYCAYSGNAGLAPTNYPNGDGEWGPSFPANYPAAGPWYYVAAECQWNGAANAISHYEMRYDQVGTVIDIDGY